MFRRFVACWVSAAAIIGGFSIAVGAQVDTPYQNKEERDFYGTGQGSGGSILDATNPMDLINRIRESSSLDDATPPSDAIDAALKAYETQPSPSAPAGTP